ncbi:hypothetical protein AVEN_53792-1, partial [Araneus ventricosus]
CIGLQETFLSSNNPLKLHGYNSVRKDAAIGSNHSGGECILTSNLYPSTPLPLHTSLQAVAVQVHTRSLVTVCCVYLPPHDVVSQQDLDTLVDQLPTPFPLRGTSSLGVTGFTTPRYPSVSSPFEFLPFLSFCFFFLPSRVGEGSLHEKLLPLCLLSASHRQQITPTCLPCVATL